MSERFPHPGPSYLKEQELHVGEHRFRAGMSKPMDAPDGWWLAMLWVADDDGAVSFRDVGPAAGPPPEPPLLRLGPTLAGSLSGMILEDGGRLAMKLAPRMPPEDPAQPWRCPLVVVAAFRWEPARVATMRPNELAGQVLTGFRRSIEELSKA